MRGIGGNTLAVIQVKTTAKNEIGEQIAVWENAQTLKGWLDLSGGEARYNSFQAKIQESTHVFIADYAPLDGRITAENGRMLINGKRYDITLLDNPMEMQEGSQWEIYLKYTGGQ